MATYYKKIRGKNYDKKTIDTAEASVQGKGDGRISLNDAKKILRTVKDSNDYSDIEKSTMKYVRDHYAFTPEADHWFRGEIRKWAASRGAAVKKARKPARKTQQPKKPVPSAAAPRHEEYAATPASAGQRAADLQGSPSRPGLLRRIIQFILIILILAGLISLLIPSNRECIKNWISGISGSTEQRQKAAEISTPPKEDTQNPPAEQVKAPEKPEESGEYYTVQVKDDLISISEKVLGNYSRWIDLYNENKGIIKNPTMIFPGQKLKLPAPKK
jgi:LysM repeat protein